MKLIIFGKNYIVLEKSSNKDSVHLRKNKIYVNHHNQSPNVLLKEFLAKRLYSELSKIYEKIKTRSKVGLFGNLEFEIVEKIDNKKERIAKLKGNKILIKLNAVALPKSALEYIIAHEIAHIITKRHTQRFWKTVQIMCPNFKKHQKLLTKYSNVILKQDISKAFTT